MLAVESGRRHIVEFLLKYDQPVTAATLNMRNAQGSIPLHSAIVQGRKEIIGALITTAQTCGNNSLFIENGVGSTPLELARFHYRLTATSLPNQNVSPDDWRGITEDGPKDPTNDVIRTLSSQRYQNFQKWNAITVKDAEILEQIVQSLDAEGRFGDKPKARDVLMGYIEREKEAAKTWSECEAMRIRIGDMETNTAQEAKKIGTVLTTIPTWNIRDEAEKGQVVEGSDFETSYELVRDAIQQSPVAMRLKSIRGLVHLMDAQKAVDSALKAATEKPGSSPTFTSAGQEQGYRYRRRSSYAKRKAEVGVDMKEEEDKSNSYAYILDFSVVIAGTD